MIDEALATRIPEGWMPPAQMVERVRNLERFLLVSLIAEANADVARAQAEQARVYALAARTGVAEDERAGTLEQEWALRSWKAEIAAVTNTSRQAVASIMGRSAVLTEDFPLVHAALAAGEVSMAHARIVCEAGTIVVHEDPAEQAARRELLVQVALEKARSTSPGRLKDFAIKQAERLTASSLEERYDQAMGRGLCSSRARRTAWRRLARGTRCRCSRRSTGACPKLRSPSSRRGAANPTTREPSTRCGPTCSPSCSSPAS